MNMYRSITVIALLLVAVSAQAQVKTPARPAPNTNVVRTPPATNAARSTVAYSTNHLSTNAVRVPPAGLTNVTRQQQEGMVIPGSASAGLTEEQRAKVREASEKMRKEQTALYEKMRTVRLELENLAKAENYDETAIHAKAQELGKVEGDLAIIRAKNYKELRAILPKDQFDRMQGTAQRPPAVQQRLNTIVNRTNAPATATPAPSPATPTSTKPATK